KHESRYRFHPEHPAPGRRSKPKDRTSSAGKPGENGIAQKGAKQSHYDGHLLQRGQAPPHGRWSYFGYVHWGQYARRADGYTARNSRRDEKLGRISSTCRHGGPQK